MANNIQEINLKVADYLPENFIISANWKSHNIRLNQLEEAANAIRVAKGEEPFREGSELSHFKASTVVKGFIRSLEASEGLYTSSVYLENNDEVSSPLIISKKGRYGGTWAHPMIALRFAAWLDPDLEVEIYTSGK